MNIYKRYKSPLLFVMIILLGAGIFLFGKMQISLFPDVTFPKIKIIADNGEQPVDKMMITVTRPLEEAIRQIPGIRNLRSTTSRGSSEISAFLDWDADIFTSQQLIESRIAQIRNDLPPNTQITVERMNPSILPVISYSLEAKNKSLIELKLLAEYTIKPYLLQVQGVSVVRAQGGKVKEFQIKIEPQKLMAYGLTMQNIRESLAKTNFISADGYVSSYRRLYLTLTDAGVYGIKDLNNVVLKSGSNHVVHLGDVATVMIDKKVEYVNINANGNEGVLVNILKQPHANLVSVSDSVQKKVQELSFLLPAGVTLKPIYNQSDFVNTSIKSIRDALLIGLLLAIVVAILFLRSTQASLTILITIPVTLAFSIMVMYVLGFTFNIMTIGAMAAALGLIIDDAVIIIEQMHRSHEEHPGEPGYPLIRKALRFLFPAMMGSSLSTIVIFIPFALMGGVAGAYFKILAYTMIITLVCSFLVTAFLMPTLYGWLFRFFKSPKKSEELPERRKWVDVLIHKPWTSIIFALIMIGAAVYTLPRLSTGFLPQMEEGTIVLDYDSPPGTSIRETNKMLNTVDSIIMSIPEVDSYSRRVGTQMGFFITEANRGDYQISLKKKRSKTTEDVISEIRNKVESAEPALRVDFGQVIGDMLGDLMSSAQPIEVKVFGTNRAELKKYADQVTQVVNKVPGTADVFDGLVIAGPNVVLKPDAEALARVGLTPDDLQQQLKTAVQGGVIGTIQEQQQLTNIRMIYNHGDEMSIDQLRDVPVLLPGGKQVPLLDLAKIDIQSGVAEQERENLQSIVAVTGRLENRDLGSVMKDIQSEIKQNIHFEKGYGVRYGGAYAEQQQSFHDLLTILILACLLVLLVSMVLFRRMGVAFLILGISVLGIGGALLALYITHTPLNVGSYTGLIMIVGIIAENAIFTYQQYHSMLQEHGQDYAINYAISARLRPKLMTAFGAIIALMPLALGIGAGAELHQPLAIAVIGGFLAALPLLLIVLPSGVRLFFRKKG